MPNKSLRPIILTILDGWGYSSVKNGNAIHLAHTPTIDKIWDKYPRTLLSASGQDVGLPPNQMGNSEVGHTTIGAGRIINQDLVRIDKSIYNKTFFQSKTIHRLCNNIQSKKTKLHIIGLCSNGGVHSHINHLKAIISIVYKYDHYVCIHIITDGRDTAPQNASKFLEDIISYIKPYKNIEISTISGRYYSMDRDCRWSRTEKSYKSLTENEPTSDYSNNPLIILEQYYQQGISDEFIPPTKTSKTVISDNDGILFFNFRPDRIRQLLHAFTKPQFKGFQVKQFHNLDILTFTEYDSTLNISTVFPVQHNQNFLGQIISQHNFKQLRLAETEKYAHVTYFFNGGIEEPFPGEDRELIPSPKVETYDLSPEMSANQLTESIIKAIDKNIYKLIIINYANPDMVGHTGNLKATIESINIIDKCINKLFNKVKNVRGTLIITADHGNAEYMLTEENKPCKSHSTNLVPLILIENIEQQQHELKQKGSLADIAPTILELIKIPIPKEMNGKSLLHKKHAIK
uniref:2,3-bisphosphoglycerate-independent phosphoglycerate mutase n=1 Tax=Callithamnion tetricum TaxID=193179 RepID=A0A4D6WLV5_9FLOR|nr:Phosphoglycerate mutase [Callithamnion tetricum]